jgi:hypothetical protein
MISKSEALLGIKSGLKAHFPTAKASTYIGSVVLKIPLHDKFYLGVTHANLSYSTGMAFPIHLYLSYEPLDYLSIWAKGLNKSFLKGAQTIPLIWTEKELKQAETAATIQDQTGINRWLDYAIPLIEQRGIPFGNEYANLNKLDEYFNSSPIDTDLPNIFYQARMVNGLLLAYLNKNLKFKNLVADYRHFVQYDYDREFIENIIKITERHTPEALLSNYKQITL